MERLQELAAEHTLRESWTLLVDQEGLDMSFAAFKKTAQRHTIRFRPAKKGGKRDGAG